MATDNEQLVRTRTLSWEELARKAWGQEWTKPEIAYEFTGRKFEEPKQGGPYNPEDFDL